MDESKLILELAIREKAGGFVFRHEAMATELQLFVRGVEEAYARQASLAFFNRIDDIESKLSLYRESSDVSRINLLRLGEETKVSEECVACLEQALLASRITEGAFHPFLGIEALRVKGSVPVYLKELVAASSPRSESNFIEVDPSSRRVRKVGESAILDLGGIGKGFALDMAAEELDVWEIPEFLANIGGSTLLFGSSEESEAWTGTLGDKELKPFRKGAISSSGVGFQGAHIVRPYGGEPATVRWRAFARQEAAGMADALTTGAMLMSVEQLESLRVREPAIALAVSGVGEEWGVERFCEWTTG